MCSLHVLQAAEIIICRLQSLMGGQSGQVSETLLQMKTFLLSICTI